MASTDLETEARQIASAVASTWRGARPLRVVIDGPSGSGKTTFAAYLADWLAEDLAQRSTKSGPLVLVLNSDDWMVGWESYAATTRITEELLTGERVCYPHFDWVKYEVTEEVCPDPRAAWIVEGSGSLTAASAQSADFTVWVEAPKDEAKERALARDGDSFAPWWEVWKKQEECHALVHQPKSLADYIVTTG